MKKLTTLSPAPFIFSAALTYLRIGLLVVSCAFILFGCTSSSKTVKYKNKTSSTRHGTPIIPGNFDAQLLSTLVNNKINEKRMDEGRNALQVDELLYNASTDQNHYMMMHGKAVNDQVNEGKEAAEDRVKFYGGNYNKVGENVQFMGFRTIKRKYHTVVLYPTYEAAAEEIADNWIGSHPHLSNLLNNGYYRVGTSVSLDAQRNGIYASQVFGSNPRP